MKEAGTVGRGKWVEEGERGEKRDEKVGRQQNRVNDNEREWLRVEEIGREGMSERRRKREEERSREKNNCVEWGTEMNRLKIQIHHNFPQNTTFHYFIFGSYNSRKI